MPKAPAAPEAVEAVRERILREALFIINEEGYGSLSMRKLARRLGFTAKTIYNYYSNKDELYLMALIEGFQELTRQFKAACDSTGNPVEKLRSAVHAYVAWGIENKHYYNIMFSMDTPKYIDYIGTKMEPIADRQNRTALEVASISAAILTEVADFNGSISREEVPYRLLQLWSILHGMVSLYISRVYLEVGDLKEAFDRIIEDILQPFSNKKTSPRRKDYSSQGR
jgi:AcrR family transcriptional regulator